MRDEVPHPGPDAAMPAARAAPDGPAGLPARADVVVIGAGVVGASVAYHLTQLGCRDVLLLDRARIGSGTTWHAGGNMETYRSDPLLGEMVAYTVDLFPRLARETGVAFGWRQTGRVHFTADPGVFAGYRSVPARSRARGVEVEVLGPREVVQKLPVASAEGLLGGLWIPNDGRVDPTNLAMAYARGARNGGARVVENLAVTRILTADGAVKGVETEQGSVTAASVVLAAGLWSTTLARTCGVRLPLVALHHFYLLTKPMTEVGRDLPLFLSYDEAIWGREDVGGLLVGVFDRDAIPLEPNELPAAFAFSLLPENWSQIAPNMPVVMRRFPLLERAEIRALVNGPESFTPDGEMLLGEVPGLRGLHLCTGMNSNGIALAAGAGRATAERLVRGRSELDVTKLDVRRFMPFQGGDRYRHLRMSELFEIAPGADNPAQDFTRTRMIRRGPAHTLLAARGAVFKSSAGMERAAWFGDGPWPDAVAREVAAARGVAAFADTSGHAKLWLEGPDAAQVLERATGAHGVAVPGAAAPAPFLNAFGGVEALPVVLALGPDRFLLMAEPEDHVRLETTLRTAMTSGDRAVLVDVSAGWSAFDLHGPAAARLVDDLAGASAVPAPGRLLGADLGFAPATVARLEAAGVLRVLAPADHGAALAEDLLARIPPIGTLAVETLRVERRCPRFGYEATPGLHAAASGLAGALELARAFVGRDAVLAAQADPPARSVAAWTVASAPPGSLAEEPVMAGGVAVGHVTSSAYVPVDGRLALFALTGPAASPPSVLAGGAWTPLAAR